jgi:hypothetical protein
MLHLSLNCRDIGIRLALASYRLLLEISRRYVHVDTVNDRPCSTRHFSKCFVDVLFAAWNNHKT